MTTRDWLKRTPLRLATTFTVLFTTTVIVLFGILYFSVSAELESRIRTRVQEASDALVAVDAERGFDDLAAVVTSQSETVRDSDTILSLVGTDGRFQAGNVRDVAITPEWLVLARSTLPFVSDQGDPDDRYFAIWHRVSKGQLLVGESDREIRQTQVLLLRGLAWSLGATVFLAGLCGAYLARRAQARIEALATTLSAISAGQIGVRVPMSGSEDDIDHIGEQINNTLNHLQRLIENVNQASSDIAHDLKNPIGRVRQKLDLTRRKGKDTAEFRDAIDGALIELDHIVETFEALLRIAQIEAGARKARFQNLDLRSVLREVKDIYDPVVEDAGNQLTETFEPSGPAMIRGDRELLVQLFANLIENAVRHCPPGTRVRMAIEAGEETYEATVTDDGPGIPERERAKVFRRLYRVERARSSAGSGLGLSLVAAIADLHDAKATLSGSNPGLKVSIGFPRVRV